MPIPKEILSVKRPKNTIVIVYGKNKDRYAVRQRIGCRYDKGRNLPINGPVIGHIVDGKYIPKESKETVEATVSNTTPQIKDWANIVCCDNVFKGVIKELTAVYNPKDVYKLYCIAILRVCYPGIKDYELKERYDDSFLSELYPDVALSKNTVSKFLSDLGKAYLRIVSFMQNRVSELEKNHNIVIDGTLKTNNSRVNSLSDFSRKSRIKGNKEISIIYAYDLEKMEPICSKCYNGNMLDLTAYQDFLKENKIKKGVIVADKGFPSSAAYEYFAENLELTYLNPIKRNSKYTQTHNLYEHNEILEGYEAITFRKEKCLGVNKWLYSFRDSYKAMLEEKDWLERCRKKKTYTLEEHNKKKKSFGTIILESELDLPAKKIYDIYKRRWEIEIIMKYYKSIFGFDDTRVHSDYSVIGSEFCDFLSSILTCKLINNFDKYKLLEEKTYKKVMSDLRRAKKIKLQDETWTLRQLTKGNMDVLEKLGLL